MSATKQLTSNENRVQKGKAAQSPKLSTYWKMRYWHAFSWYTVLFKNLRKVKNNWAQREMETAVRGMVEELKKQGAPWQNNWYEVPSHVVDSVDDPFVRELVKKAEPFVLRGAANNWDAIKKWNIDFFAENYGEQTVKAKNDLMDDGVFIRRKVSEIVADLKAGKPVYSGFTEDIILGNPELLEDINRKDIVSMVGKKYRDTSLVNFFRSGTIISFQMFIQGAKSHTTYHMTKFHNFFVEFEGKKEWILVDPKLGMGVDQQPSAAFYFISPLDVDQPDSPDSLYSYIPKLHVVIEPGDILFIPSYWWHDVKTYKSSHVMGMAIRTSDWIWGTWLLDFLMLFDKKTFKYFYTAFIKGKPLSDAEDSVVHIDKDLKRLGLAGKKN